MFAGCKLSSSSLLVIQTIERLFFLSEKPSLLRLRKKFYVIIDTLCMERSHVESLSYRNIIFLREITGSRSSQNYLLRIAYGHVYKERNSGSSSREIHWPWPVLHPRERAKQMRMHCVGIEVSRADWRLSREIFFYALRLKLRDCSDCIVVKKRDKRSLYKKIIYINFYILLLAFESRMRTEKFIDSYTMNFYITRQYKRALRVCHFPILCND